jgi:hypothetical protein
MEQDPARNEIRKARRSYSLPPNPTCTCGESRPEAFDMHHPCGEANAPDFVVPRCKNCHAVDGEDHRDAGVNLLHSPDRTALERLQAALHGLIEFLRRLADQLERWAEFVGALVRALDDRLTGWREWPEMQS